MKKFSAVTFVAALALAFGNNAQAQLFQDDFESNTTVNTVAHPSMIPPTPAGDFDPDAPANGSWTIREDYDELAQVSSYTGGNQPTAAHSGNNYLIAGHNCDLPGSFCGASRGLATANLTSSVSKATVDFWTWSRQWDGTDKYDVIQAKQSGLGRTFEISLFNFSDGTNEIKWGSVGGGGGTVLNAQLTTDAWNHIVIDYDGAPGFTDITINDQPTETLATALIDSASFDQLLFRAEHHGYYDDIRIIPEPATATLVLLGLSSLGLFRRHRG